jgi:signal transduction histidine kinase
VPSVDVSDRDYFQALRDNPSMQVFLGAPVENRSTGAWTIYVAHRLNGPDHRFIGMALGAVELRYFEKFYGDVDLGQGSCIAMWRLDGVLLAHFPIAGGVGTQREPDENFSDLAPGRQRVGVAQAASGQAQRLLVTTRLVDEPIVIGVSRTMEEVLAAWRSDSAVVAAGAAACTLAIFAIMTFLTRQLRAYDTLAMALRARDKAERGRRDAEAQLLQAQKLEAIGRVAAGVAHDFNNLLMVVLSNAELLGGRLRGDPQSERRLATIGQAVERGSTLTQQMLAFSRQQILLPAALDLNAALRSIEELLRSSVGGTVRFELRLATALWPVHADPGQVKHTILNLAINARDAMPDGGGVVISTANRTLRPGEQAGQLSPGDYVVVTVADTGTGMTAEVMNRAFEPFFTTKERGQGSGLGLSQVFGFVRQSHGDVLLDTAPGLGTTISIMLPRVHGGTASKAGQEGSLTPDAASERRRPVVMVVDDDDAVREAVVSMLEDQAIAVVQADSGQAALRMLGNDQRVGLVLTDFAMPGMTGAELAVRLREENPQLPVVFMTGYARPEPLLSERWVLRKPFTSRFLAEMLNEVFAVQLRGRSAESGWPESTTPVMPGRN